MGLWLTALNVRYRDVAHTIPFLIQFWMFASPVIYPISLVPERWRALYNLNPMAGVIGGFRWCFLGTGTLDLKARCKCNHGLSIAVGWGGFLQAHGKNLCGYCLMADIAIRVEQLSKQYEIGVEKPGTTLSAIPLLTMVGVS